MVSSTAISKCDSPKMNRREKYLGNATQTWTDYCVCVCFFSVVNLFGKMCFTLIFFSSKYFALCNITVSLIAVLLSQNFFVFPQFQIFSKEEISVGNTSPYPPPKIGRAHV